jgi:hypothetical protein
MAAVAGRSTRSLGIMLQTVDTNREFESLARSYLSQHPGIVHEWRPVKSALSGGRTDLICRAENGAEVFASLTSDQITVGSGTESNDFEHFGRGLSDAAVAKEAFERFEQLLQRAGEHDA